MSNGKSPALPNIKKLHVTKASISVAGRIKLCKKKNQKKTSILQYATVLNEIKINKTKNWK